MNVRNSGTTMDKANWYTWCEMQDLIKSATGFHPTLARSVLAGPLSTWKDNGISGLINSRVLPPSVGAFAAVRVDFVNMKPLTPLFAWKTEPEMS